MLLLLDFPGLVVSGNVESPLILFMSGASDDFTFQPNFFMHSISYLISGSLFKGCPLAVLSIGNVLKMI